jgi:hypothetical protein
LDFAAELSIKLAKKRKEDSKEPKINNDLVTPQPESSPKLAVKKEAPNMPKVEQKPATLAVSKPSAKSLFDDEEEEEESEEQQLFKPAPQQTQNQQAKAATASVKTSTLFDDSDEEKENDLFSAGLSSKTTPKEISKAAPSLSTAVPSAAASSVIPPAMPPSAEKKKNLFDDSDSDQDEDFLFKSDNKKKPEPAKSEPKAEPTVTKSNAAKEVIQEASTKKTDALSPPQVPSIKKKSLFDDEDDEDEELNKSLNKLQLPASKPEPAKTQEPKPKESPTIATKSAASNASPIAQVKQETKKGKSLFDESDDDNDDDTDLFSPKKASAATPAPPAQTQTPKVNVSQEKEKATQPTPPSSLTTAKPPQSVANEQPIKKENENTTSSKKGKSLFDSSSDTEDDLFSALSKNKEKSTNTKNVAPPAADKSIAEVEKQPSKFMILKF